MSTRPVKARVIHGQYAPVATRSLTVTQPPRSDLVRRTIGERGSHYAAAFVSDCSECRAAASRMSTS